MALPSTLVPIANITDDTHRKLLEHLNSNIADKMTKDVSTYARGRARLWLNQEPTLSYEWTVSPALKDDRLWNWINAITPDDFVPDAALISRGPVGINPHRDARYADYEAYGVNLGEPITWQYRQGYQGFCYGPQQDSPLLDYAIPAGVIFKFNSKNEHGVGSPITKDRWSINIWRFK